MNWSPVLDTAIALVFIYVVLSLVSIAINEVFVRIIGLRSRMLIRGLRELLNDPNLELVRGIYRHYSVGGLQGWEWNPWLKKKAKEDLTPKEDTKLKADKKADESTPSGGATSEGTATPEPTTDGKLKRLRYPTSIPNRSFAQALIQTLGEKGRAAAGDAAKYWPLAVGFAHEVKTSTNPALVALQPLVEEAKEDAEKLREKLETWFDQSTKSLTEFYRNYARVIAFFVGIALAVAFNADSFHMATKLWRDSGMRSAIVEQAQATVNEGAPFDSTAVSTPQTDSGEAQGKAPRLNERGRALIARMDSLRLPLGWYRIEDSTKVPNKDSSAKNDGSQTTPKDSDSDKAVSSRWAGSKFWLVRILGYLFTGAAVSMGAPFWYDLLGRLVGLRASMKSKEKTQT